MWSLVVCGWMMIWTKASKVQSELNWEKRERERRRKWDSAWFCLKQSFGKLSSISQTLWLVKCHNISFLQLFSNIYQRQTNRADVITLRWFQVIRKDLIWDHMKLVQTFVSYDPFGVKARDRCLFHCRFLPGVIRYSNILNRVRLFKKSDLLPTSWIAVELNSLSGVILRKEAYFAIFGWDVELRLKKTRLLLRDARIQIICLDFHSCSPSWSITKKFLLTMILQCFLPEPCN